MYCLSDGGGNTGEPDLADPASAELVDFFIRIVEKVYVNRRRVRVYSHHVIGQVAVDWCAALWIVGGLFKQRHANAHHYRALDLIPASKWIQDVAGVHHCHNTAHAQ